MSDDGLSLNIQNDFLAISALMDDARRNEDRAMRLVADLRAVIQKHFGQVVAMHDTSRLAGRLDDEITEMKRRAGITTATPEHRCGQCWTLVWNDTLCWNCQRATHHPQEGQP